MIICMYVASFIVDLSTRFRSYYTYMYENLVLFFFSLFVCPLAFTTTITFLQQQPLLLLLLHYTILRLFFFSL